jgi:hypothetical protein
MSNTYKAVLKGDRLEWSDEAPELITAGQPVPVNVTILDESMLKSSRTARGQQMAAALERLAAANALVDIADPATWQRETRQDRDLPSRDS